jgi:hypothetical protein
VADDQNFPCLIVYVETVSHAPKQARSSVLVATTDAILLALHSQRLIAVVALLPTTQHHAQAVVVVKVQSSTVMLSLLKADALHAVDPAKAKSSTAMRLPLR